MRLPVNPITNILLCALAVLMLASSTVNASSAVLRLGCLSDEASEDTRYLRRIITPVLEVQGYRVEFIPMGATELERQLIADTIDGDCGRDQSLEYRLKDHITKVSPPFRQAVLTIWGSRAQYTTPIEKLTLGFPEGWKTFSSILQRFGYGELRTYPSMRDLPDAVRRGEIDAFLSYYASIAPLEDELRQSDIVYHRDVLSTPVFLYLRPEFDHLIPALSEAIVAAQESDPYMGVAMQKLPKAAVNQIVFSCSLPPKFPLFERMRLFYTQAFAQLGYSFTMIHLPRAREVAELIGGRVDGSCGRGRRPAFQNSPQLLNVDVAIGRSAKQLITTVPGIYSLDDIPEQSEVFYVRGTQSSNRFLEENRQFRARGLNTLEIGMKMLAAGRIEYLVDTSVLLSNVKDYLQLEHEFHRLDLSPANGLYPYLNRRHSSLLEPLQQQMHRQLAVWPHQLLFDHRTAE